MQRSGHLSSAQFWIAQATGWFSLVGYGALASTIGPQNVSGTELTQSGLLWGATGIIFSSLLSLALSRVAGRHVVWTCLAVLVGSFALAIPWALTVLAVEDAASLSSIHTMGIPMTPEASLRFGIARSAFVLMAWSAVFLVAVLSHRVMLEREGRANADAATQKAQLALLRAQLNPHFLFNSLNSIVALVDEDPGRAKRLVRDLARLLRRALRASQSATSLQEELEFVELYVDCEKVRFEDRIQVEWDIDDAAQPAQIPSMVLQPLVENAVRYGGDGDDEPVHVCVSCLVEGDHLVLNIANTGTLEHISGVHRAPDGNGLALDNVNERLELMYDGAHRFELFERDGWVHARLELPLELAS